MCDGVSTQQETSVRTTHQFKNKRIGEEGGKQRKRSYTKIPVLIYITMERHHEEEQQPRRRTTLFNLTTTRNGPAAAASAPSNESNSWTPNGGISTLETQPSSTSTFTPPPTTPQENKQQKSPLVPVKLKHKVTQAVEKASDSLGYYVAIEAIWHVGLFATCYRYRPLVHISKNTKYGKMLVEKIQQQMHSRMTSSSSSSSSTGSSRLQSLLGQLSSSGKNHQRTLVAISEWFFFNKVIGIPLWPTKVALASYLHSKFHTTTTNGRDDQQ